MKKIIILALLAHSPLFAVDAYNGKEFKMRQTMQNVDITGTANDALDISGGAMIDGQLTVAGTTTLQGSAFSVGGSTLVVTGGKIGIGMTPTYTLDINGTEARMSTGGSYIWGDANTRISGSSTGDTISIFAGNSIPTTTMIVGYGGNNVGIGTTAPQTKLHMSSGTLLVDGNGTTDINTRNQGWAEGYARGVYATNLSGITLSSGTVLMSSHTYTASVSFTTSAANGYEPIGTLFDTSCAANAVCRVCTEGVCPAKLDAGAACTTANDAVLTGAGAGTAACVSAPAAATTHWQEIGQPASFTTQASGSVIQIYAHRN